MVNLEIIKGILFLFIFCVANVGLKHYAETADLKSAAIVMLWPLGIAGALVAVLVVAVTIQMHCDNRKRELMRSPISVWEIIQTDDGYYRHVDHVNGLLTIGFSSDAKLRDWGFSASTSETAMKDMAARYTRTFNKELEDPI